MGTESSILWSLAGMAEGRVECRAGWVRHFGSHYRTLSRFLVPTERAAETYPHPNWGFDLVVEPHMDGGYRAVCADISAEDWVDPIRLSFEKAQGHTFDLKELSGELCGACGITPDWKASGGGFFKLGMCGVKAAYAYFGSAADAVGKTAALLNKQLGTVGCVMVPQEASATSELFNALGVADVPLCAYFTVGTNGIKGTCGKRCLVVGRKAASDTPIETKTFYVVNGRFRIEGDFSKVTALSKKGSEWIPPIFTQMILKVLVVKCNHSGLTSRDIYEFAKREYFEKYPNSRECARGQEPYPNFASLVQFFRVQRKKRSKNTHHLYKELKLDGKKPTVYSFDGKVTLHQDT